MHRDRERSGHDPGMAEKLSRRVIVSTMVGAAAGVTGMCRIPVSAQERILSMASSQATPAEATPVVKGLTVVLVHGGFADASSWNEVIAQLQAANIATIAVANPLRGVEADSAYVASVVETIAGPVLLVGHSYGGLVITNVGSMVSNAVGLVYVAAMAPAEGEAMLDVAADYPQTLIISALVPASKAASEAEQDFIVDPAQYREAFAADLPEAQTRILAISQRPFVGSALATKSGPAAWATLPSWYAVATADNAIHPDQERFYAKRMGATTIEIEGGSHSIAVSQPEKVSDLIKSAVETLGKA